MPRPIEAALFFRAHNNRGARKIKFVDQIVLTVISGAGGDGVCSFRRAKYEPRGGPDGGDGGDGGSIILEASSSLSTLYDYRARSILKADDGKDGSSGSSSGAKGADLILKVPVGVQARDDRTGELIADLVCDGARSLLAAGGRGGYGNRRFRSSRNRAPTKYERGGPAIERRVKLDLKLIADVGIVGYPSVGKSTLLGALTNATPEIGDYPFTTISPNLGVVSYGEYKTFVLADIPGLIDGASKGKGLGIDFLRHVERSRLILHLIDSSASRFDSSRSIARDYEKIDAELESYFRSRDQARAPELVALSKIDAVDDKKWLTDQLDELSERIGGRVLELSAKEGTGLDLLVDELIARLNGLDGDESPERK